MDEMVHDKSAEGDGGKSDGLTHNEILGLAAM